MQFKLFAIILAMEVFPTPRIPWNKNALGILFNFIELYIVEAITSCPINSWSLEGLYFNANTFEFFIIILGANQPRKILVTLLSFDPEVLINTTT